MKMEINVSMEANNQKKLEYPFSNRPKDGELLNVKGGIHWLRMPLPIALNHINLWLIEGNDGFTIIDSGMSTDEAKGIWRNIFNEFVSPKKVEKILITHMHLDHSGLAGWLSSELNIDPHFTQKEHNETQKIIGGMSDEQIDSALDYYRKCGYDKKSELENYAMSEILESLPQKIQNDYQNIWDEFLSRETPESKLVYELDKLEMALQAKIYEKDVDPEKVKPFIISAVEQIIDPDVKKVLMDILK